MIFGVIEDQKTKKDVGNIKTKKHLKKAIAYILNEASLNKLKENSFGKRGSFIKNNLDLFYFENTQEELNDFINDVNNEFDFTYKRYFKKNKRMPAKLAKHFVLSIKRSELQIEYRNDEEYRTKLLKEITERAIYEAFDEDKQILKHYKTLTGNGTNNYKKAIDYIKKNDPDFNFIDYDFVMVGHEEKQDDIHSHIIVNTINRNTLKVFNKSYEFLHYQNISKKICNEYMFKTLNYKTNNNKLNNTFKIKNEAKIEKLKNDLEMKGINYNEIIRDFTYFDDNNAFDFKNKIENHNNHNNVIYEVIYDFFKNGKLKSMQILLKDENNNILHTINSSFLNEKYNFKYFQNKFDNLTQKELNIFNNTKYKKYVNLNEKITAENYDPLNFFNNSKLRSSLYVFKNYKVDENGHYMFKRGYGKYKDITIMKDAGNKVLYNSDLFNEKIAGDILDLFVEKGIDQIDFSTTNLKHIKIIVKIAMLKGLKVDLTAEQENLLKEDYNDFKQEIREALTKKALNDYKYHLNKTIKNNYTRLNFKAHTLEAKREIFLKCLENNIVYEDYLKHLVSHKERLLIKDIVKDNKNINKKSAYHYFVGKWNIEQKYYNFEKQENDALEILENQKLLKEDLNLDRKQMLNDIKDKQAKRNELKKLFKNSIENPNKKLSIEEEAKINVIRDSYDYGMKPILNIEEFEELVLDEIVKIENKKVYKMNEEKALSNKYRNVKRRTLKYEAYSIR